MAGADLGSQKYEGKVSLEWERVIRVALFAAIVGAPALHFWYMMLEWLFPGTETFLVLCKIAMDNFVFTPISILIFFTFLGLSQGMDLPKLKRDLTRDYFPTLRTSFMVWPAASIINFAFVPLNFRPLFIGSLSVFWNAYLSYVKHHKSDAPILPVFGSPTTAQKAI